MAFRHHSYIVGVDPGVRACGIAVFRFAEGEEELSNADIMCGLFLELPAGSKAVKELPTQTWFSFSSPGKGGLQMRVFPIADTTEDLPMLITRVFTDRRLCQFFFPDPVPDIKVTIIEKGVFLGFANEILLNAGWIGGLFYQMGSPVFFVNPGTVKKQVLGSGKITKTGVASKLREILKLPPHYEFTPRYSDHIWDALMYAIYGWKLEFIKK